MQCLGDNKNKDFVIQNIQQGGVSQVRDMYSAAQAGAQGPNSGQNAIIYQSFNDANVDYISLRQGIESIIHCLKINDGGTEDADILLG